MYDNLLDSLESSDRVLSLFDLPSQESVDLDVTSFVRPDSVSDDEISSCSNLNVNPAHELSSPSMFGASYFLSTAECLLKS